MTIDYDTVLDDLIHENGYDFVSATDVVERIREELDIYEYSNLSDYWEEG